MWKALIFLSTDYKVGSHQESTYIFLSTFSLSSMSHTTTYQESFHRESSLTPSTRKATRVILFSVDNKSTKVAAAATFKNQIMTWKLMNPQPTWFLSTGVLLQPMLLYFLDYSRLSLSILLGADSGSTWLMFSSTRRGICCGETNVVAKSISVPHLLLLFSFSKPSALFGSSVLSMCLNKCNAQTYLKNLAFFFCNRCVLLQNNYRMLDMKLFE